MEMDCGGISHGAEAIVAQSSSEQGREGRCHDIETSGCNQGSAIPRYMLPCVSGQKGMNEESQRHPALGRIYTWPLPETLN